MPPRAKVVVFTLFAFGFTWLFWVPAALIAQEVWDAPPWIRDMTGAGNPGAWGPLIGAIAVQLMDHGWSGVRALLGRGMRVRLGRWWIPALLLFPLLIGGAIGIASLFGEPIPEMPAWSEPLTLPIAFVWILLLGGPLQEEFGWRGMVFETLRRSGSAVIAATIAGFLWGVWHLPLFFVPREEFYYNRPLWGLLLTTLLVGIIIAWIYANTGGSVFAAMVAHASFNWSHWAFPTLGQDQASLLLFVLYGVIVAWILWRYGPRTLAGRAARHEPA